MAKAKPSLSGLIRRTDIERTDVGSDVGGDVGNEPAPERKPKPATKTATKLARPRPARLAPALTLSLTPSGDDLTAIDLPATGHTIPVGVGLRQSELAALDEIVEETGVSRNALLRYAARDFVKRFRRGEIDLTSKIVEPPPRRKRLSIE